MVVALVGGACGGSSTKNTTATTAKKQDIAADKAAAVAANLVQADFPARWTSKPQDSSPDTTAGDQEAAKCIGISVQELEHTGPTDTESPDFSAPDDSVTVSSSVGFAADVAEAQHDFDELTRPQVPGCLSTFLSRAIQDDLAHPANPADALPAGVKVGAPTVVKQAAPPGIGDHSVEYRFNVPITGPRISLSVVFDLLFILKGRAEIALTYQGVGKPVPADKQAHYAALVAGRITRV